ncbi:MAG: DUF6353 family protein [Faecalibacterium sp.]|nr:DUF6353 family protein [Faecalibacterium sp.]
MVEDKLLCYEPISKRYFHATEAALLEAFYSLNRDFALNGYASMNDLYNYLGLDYIPEGDLKGWCADYLAADWEYFWIDFSYSQQGYAGENQEVLLMGNISRKSKKKLIQKMKATYHEIQLIKIMYTEEALPRYKVPTKLYCRNDGRNKYPHIAIFFGKKNHPRDVVEVYQHHVKPIKYCSNSDHHRLDCMGLGWRWRRRRRY